MGDRDKKDRKLICLGCSDELAIDHLGIKCPNSHDICVECSKQFVSECFSNPEQSIPAKCPYCFTRVIPISFEMQLTEDQQDLYLLVIAQKEIQKDEILQTCPYCTWHQISIKDNTMTFVYCQKQGCEKVSCLICYKDIEKIQENYDDDEEECKKTELYDKHFKCHEFKDLKIEFDDTIITGQQRRCPTCKLSGQKDDSCTHMTCSQCQNIWCYLCGKKESDLIFSDLDKENNNIDIYSHNQEWYENINRCPMYFNEISEVDQSWPEDDQECKALFHQKLTLINLKQFIEKIGIDKYNELVEVFPSCGSASGYSLETIQNSNQIIFERQI